MLSSSLVGQNTLIFDNYESVAFGHEPFRYAFNVCKRYKELVDGRNQVMLHADVFNVTSVRILIGDRVGNNEANFQLRK